MTMSMSRGSEDLRINDPPRAFSGEQARERRR